MGVDLPKREELSDGGNASRHRRATPSFNFTDERGSGGQGWWAIQDIISSSVHKEGTLGEGVPGAAGRDA